MSQEPGQLVRSPEQVTLFLPVAGPTTRILAYAIDLGVMIAVVVIAWLGLVVGIPPLFGIVGERVLRELRSAGTNGLQASTFLLLVAVVTVVQLVVELGYFVFVEHVTGGQSLGKRWLGLRVVQDGGYPIGLRQSLVRNLLRTVDWLPGSYLVGLVAMLVSDEGKRLGDVAAGTVVVRLDRPPAPAPLPAVPREGASAFAFGRAQLARLGPTEVTLAVETLRRIDALDADRADEVLARAAAALATRMGHPPVAPADRAAFLRAVLDAAGLE